MYISGKKPLISTFILCAAVVKIVAAVVEGCFRLFVKKSSDMAPDMMDIFLWNVQLASSFLQVTAIVIIYSFLWKRLKSYLNAVSDDDRRQMGELQREYLGNKLPSLSASSVSRLLQIWAVILIGAETIYIFTSIIYRKFIAMLMEAFAGGSALTDGTFVMIYNMTHGFKYIEILTALLLGVIMTGIFLQDRYLKIISIGIAIAFSLAFGVIQMQTVSLMGKEVGIVWTSIIYHVCETVGLVFLAVYLTKRYKGL